MADERILIEIDANADGAVQASRQTGQALRNLGREAERASRSGDALSAAARKQRQSLGELASVAKRAATGIGLVGGAAVTHLVKTGAEFEQQMARVKAVTGENTAGMGRLTKEAQRLGAVTKFSAGQAAEAMYELASAGFDTDETIKALPGTLALAASSGIELKAAAEISSNALNGFRLKASESGHVADVMAEAVNRSSVEMSDLGLSMSYLGGVAVDTGQSLEAVTAAVSVMGDAGIKGEKSGTALRAALQRLAAPTKSVHEGLGMLNLKASDLQGPKGLKALPEILRIIEGETKKVDQATRNNALALVFGMEASSGMSAVLAAGSTELGNLTRAYERSEGAAKKSADTMNRTVAGAFEALTGSIETVEIGLYQRFQEPLRKALVEGAALVNSKGRDIEEFLNRVTGTDEFKTADLAGQIAILVREAGEEVDKLDIPAKLGDAMSDAIPHIAEAAKDGAVIAAKAFGEGFVNSSPLGRLVLATWLINKAGGFAAFRAAGTQAGAATAAGAAAGATAGAAGLRGSLVNAAKSAAPMMAAAVAVAFGPELVKEFGGRNESFKGMVLGDFAEQAKKLRDVGDSRGLSEMAEAMRGLARETPEAARELRAFAGDLDDAAKDAAGSFENVAKLGGKNLAKIKQAAADAGFEIKQRLGQDTFAGKQALSQNMRAAAAAIKKSMDAGIISTKTGTREIEKLMREALALYGIKGKEATNYLRKDGVGTKGQNERGAATGKTGAARGGFFLGQPGAKGRDSIPMNVNGQSVIAAEGEYVGIFNRHQQAELNQLTRQGGYRGLSDFMATNNRPHHMSGGGIIHAARGLVTGDTDYSPELGRRLEAMARSAGQPIFVQSGGRSIGEQQALYNRFKGSRPVANPGPNAPHVRGVAADITPGRERFGALAARFGLGFTVPEEAWHIQLLDAAVSSGVVAPAEAERLKRVMWDGPGGALGAVGQGGLDAVRAGAQSKLDAIAAQMGAGTATDGGAGSAGGVSSAGGSLDRSQLEALWRQAGGASNMARLMAAIALAESSGNPGVTNSIGARGLWQVIPSTAKAFGFDWSKLTDPLLNAKAAVAIQRGQGLGAWEAYSKGMHTRFMATGGIVGAATGKLSDAQRFKRDDKTARKQYARAKSKSRKTSKRRARFVHGFPDVWLDRVDGLTEKVSLWERLQNQMSREHGRSDEDSMLAALDEQNPDGSYKLSQADADRRFKEIVSQHVGELSQQLGLADQVVGAYDGPTGMVSSYAKALARVREGITERQTSERTLISQARANASEIKQTQAAFFKEKRKKKPSKPELRRLQDRLDALRSQRHRLIGTRSTETSLGEEAGGLLGSTRDGLAKFRAKLPDLEKDAANAPLDAKDKRADRQDLLDEIQSWTGRVMAARPAADATSDAPGGDNGLADLYKTQRDQALKDLAVQGAQFNVFGGMSPLVGQRLVGAFAHGVDRVPETGLAYVHKDERIMPQDYGPYGLDQRTSQQMAAPVIQLTFADNSGQLVRLVDARVNGAVAKVSQSIGRRQRTLTAAPGGGF